ncbi:hypothetical protein [Ferroglobus sp.]|uniref:hypothetical protein n=1 Tax=Ferroglobus sp. TaxID=2614230 RepID=UPI0025B90115|nr:hypothetical protein [Ferroglobus sp.]
MDEIIETLQKTGLEKAYLTTARKKLLNGFLTGKNRLVSEAMSKDAKLTDFFE